MKFPIENKQVKEIYERNRAIFFNEDLHEKARIKAYEKMELIKSLVLIYEHNETLNEEEMDDLFILYGDEIRPAFPEEIRRILENK